MSDRHTHLDTRAVLLLLGCCLLWGGQQIVAKATMEAMPPMMQAAVRSVISGTLVWMWALWRGIPLFQRDGTLRAGLLTGTIFGLEFLFIYVGLNHTTASRLVVLLYLSPFVVAVGMSFISRSERLSLWQAAGLLLGFAGVALAFSDGLAQPGEPGDTRWMGDLMAVVAALLWGATTLTIRATRLSVASPEKTLFYQLAVSAVVLSLASWVGGENWQRPWTALVWGSMFFQAVVVAFASYLVWFWLIRHYPATRLASFSFLTPLFGLLFGWALLDEAITWQLLLALAAVASGILLVNRRPG